MQYGIERVVVFWCWTEDFLNFSFAFQFFKMSNINIYLHLAGLDIFLGVREKNSIDMITAAILHVSWLMAHGPLSVGIT